MIWASFRKKPYLSKMWLTKVPTVIPWLFKVQPLGSSQYQKHLISKAPHIFSYLLIQLTTYQPAFPTVRKRTVFQLSAHGPRECLSIQFPCFLSTCSAFLGIVDWGNWGLVQEWSLRRQATVSRASEAELRTGYLESVWRGTSGMGRSKAACWSSYRWWALMWRGEQPIGFVFGVSMCTRRT